MDYFVPKHVKGYHATDEQRAAAVAVGRDPDRVGLPYEFFGPGIFDVPDALADSHHANEVGVVPVEEMSDEDWRKLGLNKGAWMAEHRSIPEATTEASEKPKDGGVPVDPIEQLVDRDKAPAAS